MFCKQVNLEDFKLFMKCESLGLHQEHEKFFKTVTLFLEFANYVSDT